MYLCNRIVTIDALDGEVRIDSDIGHLAVQVSLSPTSWVKVVEIFKL